MNRQIIEQKMLYSGHYKLEVVRPDGNIRETLEFDNLITNQGLDQIASPPVNNTSFGWPYLNTHVEVGTGNATPAFTDTGCQSPLAMFPNAAGSNVESSTQTYVAATGGIGYWKSVWFYQYSTGAAAGNLTEICTGGCVALDTHVRAFSRALILDGSGNPTTLTILSDEVLRVTYELRMYFSTGDDPYSFIISGTTYTGVRRRANVTTAPGFNIALNNFNTNISLAARTGAIAAVTSQPSGGSVGAQGVRSLYTAGNYYVDFTFNFGLGDGLGTNLSFFALSNHGSWQYSLSPSLVKDNTQTMQIIMRYSWGRYTP
jgi:hypothetical protein